MPSIKIRNLTSATEPEVVSSNFLAAALDENAGLTKSTRKVTFAQVVTGGLKDGVVPIPIGSLPIATDSSLGVVQVGGNLSITPQGVLSANSYSLPIASGTVLGGIKVGSNLSITPQGVLSANSYSLPIATKQAVGGVQVGSNLSITPQGLLSVDLATLLPYLPIATANSLGMVQVGANLSITPGGVLSAPTPAAAYQLPTASETVLGGIKVGDNLTIDPDGTLNAAASSGVPLIKVTQSLYNTAFGHTDATGWIGGIQATTVVTNMSTGQEATSSSVPFMGDGCYYSLAQGTHVKVQKSQITQCYFDKILAKAITDLSAILTQAQVESIFNDTGDFNEIMRTF